VESGEHEKKMNSFLPCRPDVSHLGEVIKRRKRRRDEGEGTKEKRLKRREEGEAGGRGEGEDEEEGGRYKRAERRDEGRRGRAEEVKKPCAALRRAKTLLIFSRSLPT
jgi:hypothetical protein